MSAQSGDRVYSDATGAYVLFYAAENCASARDEYYPLRAGVRIGPYDGYASLREAVAGIARNDPRGTP